MPARYGLSLLFIVIPLSYSIDEDPYRAWEVVFWGCAALATGMASRMKWEHSIAYPLIAAYCMVLFLQQFFIPDGNPWFGLQYAIVFCAAFVPSRVLLGLQWEPEDFERQWDFAMKLLSFILSANIIGGRLFGWGEVSQNIQFGARFFGFLGDSISPIILFPLIYLILQRNYGWSVILLLSAYLTGGKAAIALLALAPILFIMIRWPPILQGLAMVGMLFFSIYLQPWILQFIDSVSSNAAVSYSLNTRLISYEIGTEYFARSPIYGIGINRSIESIAVDGNILASTHGIDEYWNVYQIHNAFIRTAAETGILGLTTFVGLCMVLIIRAISSLRGSVRLPSSPARSLIIASGLWVILFISMYQTTGWFEHGHPQFNWLLIISAIGCAADRTLRTIGTRSPHTSRRLSRMLPYLQSHYP